MTLEDVFTRVFVAAVAVIFLLHFFGAWRRRRRLRSLRRDDDGTYVWIGLDGSAQWSRNDPRPDWDAADGGGGDGGGDGGGGD